MAKFESFVYDHAPEMIQRENDPHGTFVRVVSLALAAMPIIGIVMLYTVGN